MLACSNTESTEGTGTDTTNATSTNNNETKNIKLRVITRWSDESPASKWYRMKADEFTAKNGKGITIVQDNISDEAQFLDKIRTQIAANDPYEIFIEYGGARIKDYVDAGIVLDVQPYLDADPEWANAFKPDMFNKWHYEEYPDKTFGIPCQFYSVNLYYNKELLEKGGVKVPESFEELENACDKLYKQGIQPFLIGEKDNYRAGHFLNCLVMKKYGADGVTALANRTMAYDSPQMIELYTIIKKFNDNGWFGKNVTGVDSQAENTAFLTGQTAFKWDGSWFLAELEASDIVDKFGVTEFPYLDKAHSNACQGGAADGYTITDTHDKVRNDAAIEFVKYVTNADYYAQMEQYCKGGVYPVNFESIDPNAIGQLTKDVKALNEGITEWRDDIQTYDPETHMLDTVRSALQGLFIGNSPEQCAKEIVSKMEITEPIK
jgi:ABC-type glycerol-3-phosphate transport system substrate-binding protein